MHITGGRFLVTGGASLIGSHLTQQLLEAGAAAVILFDNYALGSPEVAASLAQDRRVTAVCGDITRLPELLDALDQVDGVIALAGFLTLPLSQHPGLGLEVNDIATSDHVLGGLSPPSRVRPFRNLNPRGRGSGGVESDSSAPSSNAHP
jgi:nucleoside-diphosphate-sugar epimerase